MLFQPRAWQLLEVLIDFNGPQLTVMECAGDKYLSMASDESADEIRWIRAPITEAELKALLTGGTTVRDCLMKPKVSIVDTDLCGNSIREAQLDSRFLTEADLPSVDSTLPDEIISFHAEIYSRPFISIDGPSIVENAIGFRAFSELLLALQKLWDAIGQMKMGHANRMGRVAQFIREQTELLLDSRLVPGSVGVNVVSKDDATFQLIADEYQQLVLASGDSQSLSRLMARLQPRVRTSYDSYLSAIQRHNVQVFAQWSEKTAFLSAPTAARAQKYMEFSERAEHQTIELFGFFIGFHSRDLKFDFYDVKTDERFRGSIHPYVARQQVHVGDDVTYHAMVSTTEYRAPGSLRVGYLLEGFQEMVDSSNSLE